MKFELRDYQVRAVQAAREAMLNGSRAVLLVAPCGAGKTVIGCNIIESAVAKNGRTLFLAHREELILQCSDKLDQIGIPHGIIKSGNPRVDRSARVQVASVQTITRRLATMQNEFDLIITDEAHHATATTYQRIFERWPNAYKLGLTATPYRADGKGLGGIFQNLVEVASVAWLIEQGFLVPSRVFAGTRPNLAGVRTLGGDYKLDELECAMNKPKLVGSIVENYKRHAADRLGVVFTVSVAHSKAICEAFRAAGINAEHIDGETPSEARKAILSRLSAGFVQVVCNCAVLTEGWDCPPVSAVSLARPTKSRCLWRQMVGRGLRTSDGKTDCLILDHGGCTETHGWVTDPDRVSLTSGCDGTRPAAQRKCQACGAEYAGSPMHCPKCMAILRDPESGERRDAAIDFGSRDEMRELRSGDVTVKRRANESGLRFLFVRDLRTAREKNYSPGWATMRHFSRCRQYPPSDWFASVEPRLRTAIVRSQDGKTKRQWSEAAQ